MSSGRAGEVEVARAEIDGDARGVVAALVIRRGGREIATMCHPADALALAVRAKAPILASDAALAHACPADAELRARAVRHWLDRLSPSDFAGGAGLL